MWEKVIQPQWLKGRQIKENGVLNMIPVGIKLMLTTNLTMKIKNNQNIQCMNKWIMTDIDSHLHSHTAPLDNKHKL